MLKKKKRFLSAEGIEVTYGKTKVLSAIYASFAEKEVTAIMGPSGCGKSTLLRIFNRTLELIPSATIVSGKVYFKDEDVYDNNSDKSKIRKKIGIVQQKPLPFPMSIQENLLFGIKYHGHWDGRSKEEITKDCLEKVGLWNEVKDRLKFSASKLSIGQQQRLCFARSLANDPEILLMDEPCSALDPASTARIEELILELKKKLTMIIVTHNIAQARRISTQSLFMLEGKIVESGLTGQVLDDPDHPQVRDIVTGKAG